MARSPASRTSSFTKTFDNGIFFIVLIRRRQSIFRCAPIPSPLPPLGPLPSHRCHPPTAVGGFQLNRQTPPTRPVTVLPEETPADAPRLPPPLFPYRWQRGGSRTF